MRNVKSIEFVFENCECLEIEAKYFGGVHLEDIRTSIARIACNSIAKMQTVHSAVFEIFSEGNTEYAPFCNQSDKMVKFDRLAAWDDITQIIVHYEDNQEEVPYRDGVIYFSFVGACPNQSVFVEVLSRQSVADVMIRTISVKFCNLDSVFSVDLFSATCDFFYEFFCVNEYGLSAKCPPLCQFV